MKKSFLGVLALLIVAAFALPVIAADAPADGLKMQATKLPVVFNHSTHAKVACVDCHHLVNGAENYSKCGNAGCHDSFDKKDKSIKGYYSLMHKNAKGCVACHKKAAGSDEAMKKALTGCKKSKCHP